MPTELYRQNRNEMALAGPRFYTETLPKYPFATFRGIRRPCPTSHITTMLVALSGPKLTWISTVADRNLTGSSPRHMPMAMRQE
jgi:hypothetical protein